MMVPVYTQKKKFSQYLCFLIKSTILHISLSFFYMSCIIVTLHLPIHCVTNNASIRLYQPNFKCTMCTSCGKLAGLFSHILLDIERELFLLQQSGENSVIASLIRRSGYLQITEISRSDVLKQVHVLLT